MIVSIRHRSSALLTAGVALLLLAIAWRLTLFGISLRCIPAFDDECKIALQAKQIAHGARPLTILASPYIFPLDAYLMAPVIRFLPRNAFGARIMALAFGLLTVAFSLLILRRFGSWKDTWPGIALVLFPSAYLLVLQVGCALPGYPTLMLLGTLVVWLALRHAEAGRRLWIPAFLAGLGAGLAASDTLLSLPILLMGGAMIAVARNRRTALVSTPVFALGALLGFSPHLVATRLDSGAFQSVEQSISLNAAVRRIVDPLLSRTLPAACGWGAPIFPDHEQRLARLGHVDLGIGIALLGILLVVTGLSVWKFLSRWRQERWPRMDAGLVFIGISWMCFALFIFSARSHYRTYRYLIPFVWGFPFIITCLYRHANTAGRWVVGLMTVSIVALNGVGSIHVMQCWTRPGFSDFLKAYSLEPVYHYLDQRGISRCYGTYADAYRITYETDERIVCSQPFNERFPGWAVPFKEVVDASTNVAYVLSDTYHFPPSQLEQDMARMQVTSRRTPCGHYVVFTDFVSALPPPGPALPRGILRATTATNPNKAGALVDGNYTSRWTSPGAQEPGMWIEVRWAGARPVSALATYHNGYGADRARGVCLTAWDGKAWKVIRDSVPCKGEPFEFVNQHPVYGNTLQHIRFDPVTTDRLRLEITEPEPGRNWTIGDIRVFEAAQSLAALPPAPGPAATPKEGSSL